jgi:hypothetical protein
MFLMLLISYIYHVKEDSWWIRGTVLAVTSTITITIGTSGQASTVTAPGTDGRLQLVSDALHGEGSKVPKVAVCYFLLTSQFIANYGLYEQLLATDKL